MDLLYLGRRISEIPPSQFEMTCPRLDWEIEIVMVL